MKFQSPPPSSVGSFKVSKDVLVALDLFNGEVMFKADGMKRLEKMLEPKFANNLAPCFCDMRGVGFRYNRSDLELLCTASNDLGL